MDWKDSVDNKDQNDIRNMFAYLYGKCLHPLPNKPLFFNCLQYKSFETLWEIEKVLVTSNFSFS